MWIVALPLFTIFNLLLGKTWRIWKIVAQSSFKKIRVPQYKVVVYALLMDFGFFIVPQLALLMGGAPKAERVNSDVNKTDFAIECTQEYQALSDGFAIGAMLVSVGLGLKYARDTSGTVTVFNESKYIGFAIYNIGLLVVVCLPLSLVIEQQPNVTFLLRVVAVVLISCTCCGSLILPKVQLIRSQGAHTHKGSLMSTTSATSPGGGSGVSATTSPSTIGTGGSNKPSAVKIECSNRQAVGDEQADVDSNNASTRVKKNGHLPMITIPLKGNHHECVTKIRDGLIHARLLAALQQSEQATKAVTFAGAARIKVTRKQVEACREALSNAKDYVDNVIFE
jgi:hypothetical protein